MNLSYKARYYHPDLLKAVTADISFDASGILFSYTNPTGKLIRHEWRKDQITVIRFSSGIIELKYNQNGQVSQLDITDRQAIAAYRDLFKTRSRWFGSHKPGQFILLFIAGFLLTLMFVYVYMLPFIADKVAQHFPVEMEISMGNKMYTSILEQSVIDSSKTTAINNFFDQLDIESEYPVKITVVKDTIVNAFAVPGGGIVVYDAILNKMQSPETLAALLLHEYSHVELKHATRNVFRNLAGYLFISILVSDINAIAAIVLQNAENLRTLKYSRELEQEADANGLTILKRNKLSPDGMIQLFEQLKKQETAEVNELLSTHPELNVRIAKTKSFMENNPYDYRQNDSLTFYFNQLQSPSW